MSPARPPLPSVALVLFHHNMEVDICGFGVRHVHSAIKAHGYPVATVYVGFDPESAEGLRRFGREVLPELIQTLTALAPTVVGFSVFSSYAPTIRRAIAAVRAALPGTIVVAGGPEATLAPERMVRDVDYLFRGECESAIRVFLDRLSRGQELHTAPNVCCVRAGQVLCNPLGPLEALDGMARPDFEDDGGHIHLNSRFRQIQGSMTWYSMMASRGCPYACAYCVNPGQRAAFAGLGSFLRRRSVESVLEELGDVRRRNPHLEKVYFYDEVFTTDLGWLGEFAAQYPARIGVPFFCQTDPRIDNSRAVPLLARAGVKWLSSGIQGSPRVSREQYNRRFAPEDVWQIGRLANDLGITPIFDLIVDDPFSTDADRLDVLEILLGLPRPFVLNTYSLLYFPGYPLTRRALETGVIGEDDVEGTLRERFDWNRFMRPGKSPEVLFWECLYDLAARSELPGDEIRHLAHEAATPEHRTTFIDACLSARADRRPPQHRLEGPAQPRLTGDGRSTVRM